MLALAVHGDRYLRLDPAVELLELATARMAGHMHRRIGVGDHLNPEIGKAVLHARHRLLVPWDGSGGEDHAVAGHELDIRMLVQSDTRHGGAYFALTSGAQGHDLPGGNLLELGLFVER